MKSGIQGLTQQQLRARQQAEYDDQWTKQQQKKDYEMAKKLNDKSDISVSGYKQNDDFELAKYLNSLPAGLSRILNKSDINIDKEKLQQLKKKYVNLQTQDKINGMPSQRKSLDDFNLNSKSSNKMDVQQSSFSQINKAMVQKVIPRSLSKQQLQKVFQVKKNKQPQPASYDQNFDDPAVNYSTKNYIQPQTFQYRDHIKKFIKQKQATDPVLMQFQFKKQLKQILFSSSAIDEKAKFIAARFLYFPSNELVYMINHYYNYKHNYQDIIFGAVAFKNGSLYSILDQNVIYGLDRNITASVNIIKHLQPQVKHVMQNVVNWGRFQVDIMKLQRFAIKNVQNNIIRYIIDDYDLQFQFMRNNNQQITVKHKQKQIEPQQFYTTVLKQIALFVLKRQGQHIYIDFLRNKYG